VREQCKNELINQWNNANDQKFNNFIKKIVIITLNDLKN
jgi:hypothetical protein